MQSPYSHRTGSANICDEPATEMELNRRNRVEKRLQELSVNGSHNRTTTTPNNLQENYHDIVEFAQTHFNDHIKTPEGNSIIFFLWIFTYILICTIFPLLVCRNTIYKHYFFTIF